MEDEKTLDNSATNIEDDKEKTLDEKTADVDETTDDVKDTEKSESKVADYRPKVEKKKDDMIPLAKHRAMRKELQEAKKQLADLKGDDDDLNKSNDLEDLDDKIENAVKKAMSPLLTKTQKDTNIKNFEKDFESNVVSTYPALKDKKAQFMEIAFNPNLVDKYPSLDDIRKAYFSDVKPSAVKKTKTEGGSEGAGKSSERIDYSKLSDNPETYKKVMADPKLKKEYFDYRASQGD